MSTWVSAGWEGSRLLVVSRSPFPLFLDIVQKNRMKRSGSFLKCDCLMSVKARQGLNLTPFWCGTTVHDKSVASVMLVTIKLHHSRVPQAEDVAILESTLLHHWTVCSVLHSGKQATFFNFRSCVGLSFLNSKHHGCSDGQPYPVVPSPYWPAWCLSTLYYRLHWLYLWCNT